MISAQQHQDEFITDPSPSKLLLPLSSLGIYQHIARNEKEIYASPPDKRDVNRFLGKQKPIVKYFSKIPYRTSSIELYMRQFSSPKDTDLQGGEFNFFNYVSKAKIFCSISQNPIPRIAHFIFKQNYEQAIIILKSDQIPMQINLRKTLIILLEGYKKLKYVIEADPSLKSIFFGRQVFEFSDFVPPDKYEGLQLDKTEDNSKQKKKTDRDIPWIYNVNVTDLHQLSQTLRKQLTPKQRANYVYRNIIKLKDFLKYISQKQSDDYLGLIVLYLGNSQDQTKTYKYYNILLKSKDFVITDRLNYAQIVLNYRQRKQFISEVGKSMLEMTNLTNLLMFPLDGEDISCFETIIQNYLDETGDLETIAWICLAYGEGLLMKYIDMYHEKLILAHEEQEADKLEYEKTIRLDEMLLKPAPRIERVQGLFMDNANPDTEKLDLPAFVKQRKKNQNRSFISGADMKSIPKICYICFKQRLPGCTENQESFIQCNRCKHGGHLSHILKWYQQTRMCPKNDCSCYCN